MIKVWGRRNSLNVQKVMWTIGELGLSHERIDAGLAFGVVGSDAFGKMNPNRRVPVVEIDGTVLWESNVIVRALAARHAVGTLWPEDPLHRALAERWMDWCVAHLVPEMTPIFWGLVRLPKDQVDWEALEAAKKAIATSLQIVEKQLEKGGYVEGDHLTIGDIPLGAALQRYLMLPMERPSFPAIEAYVERLRDRPSFKDHVVMPLS